MTNSSQAREEVKDLAASLEDNRTLLVLNLANNGMDENIGQSFVEHTAVNWNLICFDFTENNFLLEQTQEIIWNISRNKKAYDDMRLLEWKERKRMGKEEDMMRVKVTSEEKKMIVEEEAEKSWIDRDK